MIRNCPAPSVTTVRTFSMRAGLAASTVTPGSTPPDVSRTTPAIDAWAYAAAGAASTQSRRAAGTKVPRDLGMRTPFAGLLPCSVLVRIANALSGIEPRSADQRSQKNERNIYMKSQSVHKYRSQRHVAMSALTGNQVEVSLATIIRAGFDPLQVSV